MNDSLRFHGGAAGALAPFVLFLAGVAWLSLSGAPDERGFWPVLLAALALGMLLARDRVAYADALITGMAQRVVLAMVMAWLLAGAFGSVMNATGFVESLIWAARAAGVSGGVFVGVAFVVTCVVSTATGTSLGTVLICGPLLYPAGGALGAAPGWLIGAILGGAVFGDNISPVSDTTIASAGTQGADIGGVVRSRLPYAFAAAAVALTGYIALGGGSSLGGVAAAPDNALSDLLKNALPMALAPAIVIALLLRGRHLLHGLLAGIGVASILGLLLGLLTPSDLLWIDSEAFSARGLIIEGLERGVGVSILTFLLMGLVTGIERSGLVDRLLSRLHATATSPMRAELTIVGATTAVVLLITHSAVAILAVGRVAREIGRGAGLNGYRRANLLDMTVCTSPFLLPYMIPTILASAMTASGADAGMPRVSALQVGMHNLHSWALIVVLVAAVGTGWGRDNSPNS